MTQRLSQATLAQIDPTRVQRPTYDRAALQPGIVHLGVGAFMRAHLAVATEHAIVTSGDLLATSGDLRWGIVGVSLQRPDTRDALQPQDGLYTVAQRGEASADTQAVMPLQVVGCLLRVLVAPEDPSAVVDAIADARTKIVSLTVTEKGYTHDPATGQLRLDHPDVAHDLAHAHAPRSAVGFIVRGLAKRHALARGPLTLMSLDNLASNGHVLRGAVLAMAERIDPVLHAWIAASCTFPCSMVDRIVPATTDDDRRRVTDGLGLQDAWPVCAEPFFSWAVEDQFAAGRPPWQHQGIHFVPDAKPWETLKLRMVNGCHSVMAYAGLLARWPTVDHAIHQPALRTFIEGLMRDEIEPTLPPIKGVSLVAYRAALVQRWLNPSIAHKLSQIAMDGSQKIPPRWVTPIRERVARGEPIDGLCFGVAVWLHHLRGVDEGGQAYALNDPLAASLQALYQEAMQRSDPREQAQRLLGFTPVFGVAPHAPPVVDGVAKHLQSLRDHGVQGTLARMVNQGASPGHVSSHAGR
jgi:fructuronate reductase